MKTHFIWLTLEGSGKFVKKNYTNDSKCLTKKERKTEAIQNFFFIFLFLEVYYFGNAE